MKDGLYLWTRLLWDYFQPVVSSGSPVFFSLDSQTLFVLSKNTFGFETSEDCENEFRSVCSTLIEMSDRSCTLKSIVFRDVYNKFSAVIILAIQQVLVVEKICKEGDFSHEAYFPFYRKELGIYDNIKMSPFCNPHAFEMLWGKLKEEVLSIEGSKPYSITFSKGRGPLKNKQFPLSQAMFTLGELELLNSKAKAARLNQRDSSNLYRFVLKNRSVLSQRSQRLVMNQSRKEALLRQLTHYIENFKVESNAILKSTLSRNVAESLDGTFEIYFENDFFDERFRLAFRVKGSPTLLFGSELLPVFERLHDNISIITLLDNGRFFVELGGKQSLSEGDKLFFLVPNKNIRIMFATLEHSAPQADWQRVLEEIDIEQPDGYKAYYCSMPHLENSLLVSGFNLAIDTKKPPVEFKLVGGLLLDSRKRIYLNGYVPTGVQFKGALLPPDEEILVDSHKMEVCRFNNYISKTSGFRGHTVQYHGFCLEFTVCDHDSLSPKDERMLIGYSIRENGEIDVVPENVFGYDRYLCGFYFAGLIENLLNIKSGNYIPFSASKIALLMNHDIPKIPIDDESINMVLMKLPRNLPQNVRTILINQLKKEKRIPVPLLKDLKW